MRRTKNKQYANGLPLADSDESLNEQAIAYNMGRMRAQQVAREKELMKKEAQLIGKEQAVEALQKEAYAMMDAVSQAAAMQNEASKGTEDAMTEANAAFNPGMGAPMPNGQMQDPGMGVPMPNEQMQDPGMGAPMPNQQMM